MHLLGSAALILSFALLYQRRLGAAIDTYAAQAWVLAAAAAWQGATRSAGSLYFVALLTLVGNGVAVPMAMRRMVRALAVPRAIEPALGMLPSMIVGVVLVGLSILLALPATLAAQAMTRESLALALSVVLLGLLMMIARRNALAQLVGLLSLANGLILAAVGAGGIPLIVALAVANLVMIAGILFGMAFFRVRERFESGG